MAPAERGIAPGGPRRLSLRLQVTLLAAGVLLALVGAMTLGSTLLGRDNTRKLVGDNLGQLAQSMVIRLDYGMFERYREIALLAGLDTMRDGVAGNHASLRPQLERLQQTLPEYAWIGIAKPDGNVIAATGGLLERNSVAERPWFGGGLKGPFVGDVHGTVLLQALLAPSGREPLRFVDVAFPILDESGKTIAVLGAQLSWTWAQDVREAVIGPAERDAGVKAAVLREDGSVLLGDGAFTSQWRPYLQLVDGKARTHFEAPSPDRTDRAVFGFAQTRGHRSYPGLGWKVFAYQSTSIAYAPSQRLALLISIMGLIISLFGLAILWWTASRLTRPIHELAKNARALGRDPYVTMVSVVGGSSETIDLSMALRSLVRRIGGAEQKLAEANRHIEEEITDRTRGMTEDIERLKREASTDPLTGVLNRRAFLENAADDLAYARRYEHTLAVAAIDIDHFKQINDRLGHAKGDEAIRAVATLAQAAARETDRVARFGGEEFVVLLREGDLDAAFAFGERVRTMVQKDDVLRELAGVVTVSVGCAQVQPGEADIQVAIDHADQALYEAKRSGRNRVKRYGLRALRVAG